MKLVELFSTHHLDRIHAMLLRFANQSLARLERMSTRTRIDHCMSAICLTQNSVLDVRSLNQSTDMNALPIARKSMIAGDDHRRDLWIEPPHDRLQVRIDSTDRLDHLGRFRSNQ